MMGWALYGSISVKLFFRTANFRKCCRTTACLRCCLGPLEVAFRNALSKVVQLSNLIKLNLFQKESLTEGTVGLENMGNTVSILYHFLQVIKTKFHVDGGSKWLIENTSNILTKIPARMRLWK